MTFNLKLVIDYFILWRFCNLYDLVPIGRHISVFQYFCVSDTAAKNILSFEFGYMYMSLKYTLRSETASWKSMDCWEFLEVLPSKEILINDTLNSSLWGCLFCLASPHFAYFNLIFFSLNKYKIYLHSLDAVIPSCSCG